MLILKPGQQKIILHVICRVVIGQNLLKMPFTLPEDYVFFFIVITEEMIKNLGAIEVAPLFDCLSIETKKAYNVFRTLDFLLRHTISGSLPGLIVFTLK